MNIPKIKIYFTIGVFLLLLAVAGFIVRPSIQQIKKIADEINQEKTKVEKLYLQGQFLKPTQKQYEKVKPQVADLEKIFIAKEKKLDIITALEGIAAKNRLDQKIELKEEKIEKNEKVKEQAVNKKYETLNLSIKITGTYPDLIKYLTDLEALDYYINIKDFRILSSGNAGSMVSQGEKPGLNDIGALINANIFQLY
ncbi:hypothetical protein HQ544_03655 [Candidatus Falkowbacteria bacterium]|nr:hypothetical protein [Candidatus Falkowbacteria bacterium]